MGVTTIVNQEGSSFRPWVEINRGRASRASNAAQEKRTAIAKITFEDHEDSQRGRGGCSPNWFERLAQIKKRSGGARPDNSP